MFWRIFPSLALFVLLISSDGSDVVYKGIIEHEASIPICAKGHKFSNCQQKEMSIRFATTGAPGSWAIFAMSDPGFKSFSKGLATEDRFLNLVVTGSEWKALFFEVLHCPDASLEPRGVNELREDWEDRYIVRFRQAIPQYPMLARMWDIFVYVTYKPTEVEQLSRECRTVRAATSNRKAIRGLTNIIKACEQASKHDLGLLFVPD